MKAMILAAGRGERMRPLTDTIPKPLLEVASQPLIVWHIEKLASCGFSEIIINIAHLGDMIKDRLGNGSEWGVTITYSDEQKEGALESAGAIIKALPLLEDETFLVLNADIWCDYEFDPHFCLQNDTLAHLVLVPNPPHNENGDFSLQDGRLLKSAKEMFTFAGIGYYSPKLFHKLAYGKRALAPLLKDAIQKDMLSGELYRGVWHDIGTPQRLKDIKNTRKKNC